jgi:hypothetical protein
LAAVYEFDSEEAASEAEKLAHDRFQQFAYQQEWFRISAQAVIDWAPVSWKLRAVQPAAAIPSIAPRGSCWRRDCFSF